MWWLISCQTFKKMEIGKKLVRISQEDFYKLLTKLLYNQTSHFNISHIFVPLIYHIFRRSKSLDINVVVDILSDIQKDGDWEKACENIPRRLLQTADKTPLQPN
ncbi:hypothetical protein Anas_14392 [Armadillidium nasatum]|uniref:Uncharacterized protein n=1 Tax=Armadillidium nasatum TaxID=96803 RepID=A0A5N5T9W2_9CRUS|nr:hypothetical protein Anas_14392 [Armadillidium nasatum]